MNNQDLLPFPSFKSERSYHTSHREEGHYTMVPTWLLIWIFVILTVIIAFILYRWISVRI